MRVGINKNTTKYIIMKLSSIISKKAIGMRASSQQENGVSYSWIKSAKKQKNKVRESSLGLSFCFGGSLLLSARYRDGDLCDTSIEGPYLIFSLGNTGLKLTGKSNSRNICYAHQNAISDLGHLFPVRRERIHLKVLKVETGRIVCEAPVPVMGDK